MFDPEFPQPWSAYLEHRSQYPADGAPGLPLAQRLAHATGGGLPAHQVFRPAVDLRDEASVALLLADEIPQDRQRSPGTPKPSRWLAAVAPGSRPRP
ncbi:hypothetical protein [Streptantibioticus ferralitis]|uniref:Uncharacterized protein n=1 Tax=Streptantibioticus ferralitis TaxID=236510 RepID=A0ABT5Z8E5_9ACTN|nr:hypothetical protein [Streptantibioticus ferralitis]MDF2260074.1 hypothetical protein [Streptantibioticus ferralitis]